MPSPLRQSPSGPEVLYSSALAGQALVVQPNGTVVPQSLVSIGLRTVAATLLDAIGDKSVRLGQIIFIAAGRNAYDEWRAVQAGTYTVNGIDCCSSAAPGVQLVRQHTGFDFCFIGPPVGLVGGVPQDDSQWIQQVMAQEALRLGGPRQMFFQPSLEPYWYDDTISLEGCDLPQNVPFRLYSHPINRHIANYTIPFPGGSTTPSPFNFRLSFDSFHWSTTTAKAERGQNKIIVNSLITSDTGGVGGSPGATIAIHSRIYVNMTQAGTSLTQHYEVNDISGGGPYTLTLDRNLVAWSDSGTVIGVITDYCHDSILDGQGAIVTGPCNRWVSIFGGHRIRVCNWRGTNDAAEPSEQFAFDVASLDSVICDIAIVAPDNTRGCIAEADENCMFIRVNGNTCFGFNGGHGNKVLDCRIDVPANNAAVAIDTLHDVGMLGFEIRGMRAYGGQNGVYWNATHGARAYENHGVVDSEFVGQAGVGILSTVPISQLNLTGVTCKCLPSDTAWHGFQIDDTAAGSSVNWSNCSVNTAEDTTGTFAADVRGLLAGVGSVYHVDGFHSRNMTIGIYNKGTMCASRLDIDEVGVTAAFGGACFATGVASHSTISQSKLKSGANQYCIIQFEDQSVVSIDHTACLLGFSGWGNGAGVGSLRIGDDCDVSTTTLGNGTPGGGIMRPSRGTVQLNQATPVNVAFPDIRAIDVPRLTLLTRAGTYGGAPNVIVTPGTGFSVTGQALDTSTYSYSI